MASLTEDIWKSLRHKSDIQKHMLDALRYGFSVYSQPVIESWPIKGDGKMCECNCNCHERVQIEGTKDARPLNRVYPGGLIPIGARVKVKKAKQIFYDFVAGNDNMVDWDKIRNELSMERPIAVVKDEDRVAFVYATQIHEKATELGLSQMLRRTCWFGYTAKDIDQAIRHVRHVRNASWPESPKTYRVMVLDD